MYLIYPTFPGTGVLSKYAGGNSGLPKNEAMPKFFGKRSSRREERLFAKQTELKCELRRSVGLQNAKAFCKQEEIRKDFNNQTL